MSQHPIRQRDDAGVGTARGGRADGNQGALPFDAFLVFDGFFIAILAFAEGGGIAHPGFDVQHTQRQVGGGEGQRAMHHDPLGAVHLVANRADALHPRVYRITQAGAVLSHQHDGFMAHAFDGGLVVRLQQSIHGDPFVIKEAISRFRRCGRAAGLGNISLRAGEERRAQRQQPRRQPGVAEFGAAELAMHPTGRGWRRLGAQPFQRGLVQRIHKHPFGGRFGGLRRGFIGAILTPAARGQSEFGPVGGAIGRARVVAFDAGFHQPHVQTVPLPPVAPDPPR